MKTNTLKKDYELYISLDEFFAKTDSGYIENYDRVLKAVKSMRRIIHFIMSKFVNKQDYIDEYDLTSPREDLKCSKRKKKLRDLMFLPIEQSPYLKCFYLDEVITQNDKDVNKVIFDYRVTINDGIIQITLDKKCPYGVMVDYRTRNTYIENDIKSYFKSVLKRVDKLYFKMKMEKMAWELLMKDI